MKTEIEQLKQQITEHLINRFYGGKTFNVNPKVNHIHTLKEHGLPGAGAIIEMLDKKKFKLLIQEL